MLFLVPHTSPAAVTPLTELSQLPYSSVVDIIMNHLASGGHMGRAWALVPWATDFANRPLATPRGLNDERH